MLFVVLHLGGSRYALDVRCIAEVLPLLTIQPVPGAPDGIAGVILYRGAPIPVVDLNQTIGGDHSGRHASMRLVVVNIAGDGGQARQIALITEGATGTIRLPLSDFKPPVVTSEPHPALGKVAIDASGMIQQLNPERLLSPEARARIYQEIGAA